MEMRALPASRARKPLDHRHHPRDLLGLANRFGAPGRVDSPADVDPVPPPAPTMARPPRRRPRPWPTCPPSENESGVHVQNPDDDDRHRSVSG